MPLFGATPSYGADDPASTAFDIMFRVAMRRIDMIVYEDRHVSSNPFVFRFAYHPKMGLAPIHELTEGRDTAVKACQTELWTAITRRYRASISREPSAGSEINTDAKAIARWWAVR